MDAPNQPGNDEVAGFHEWGGDEGEGCCEEPNEDEADAVAGGRRRRRGGGDFEAQFGCGFNTGGGFWLCLCFLGGKVGRTA